MAFFPNRHRAGSKVTDMHLTTRTSVIVVLGLLVAVTAPGLAQRSAAPPAAAVTPATATARIVAAAQALLTTLDEAGRAKVQFPFEGPQKARWSNLRSEEHTSELQSQR